MLPDHPYASYLRSLKDELAKDLDSRNPQKLEYELPPKMLVLTFAMCLRGETAHDGADLLVQRRH